MLYIHSMETFGTQDGPGVRLVVFVQGCQFKCWYCHNPDTQIMIEDGKRCGKLVSEEEILEQLEKMRGYMEGARGGGLTVSGGEPTLQATAVGELFKKVRRAGFHTALDSNGGLFSEEVKELLAVTDLLLLDAKQINEKKHLELTGQSNKTTLEVAAWREKTGQPMWLRYVLVPGMSDDEADLRAWADHFADFKTVKRVEILPYHVLGVNKYEALGWEYKLKGVEPPTLESREKTRQIFEETFGKERVVLK